MNPTVRSRSVMDVAGIRKPVFTRSITTPVAARQERPTMAPRLQSSALMAAPVSSVAAAVSEDVLVQPDDSSAVQAQPKGRAPVALITVTLFVILAITTVIVAVLITTKTA